jgi:hypothetical protein
MFLFTDRVTSAAQPTGSDATPHAATLKQASRATGVSFDYLARTAERESNFNPVAKAPTSSATGMFQFLEQTWLGMVKQEGAKFGLAAEAAAIGGSGGRHSVADPAMRQRILALRENPDVAATMAGAFAARNGRQLEESLGRKPKEGELYIAHFLGAAGAREFIGLAEAQPDAKAAARFPDAAAANRSVFFDRGGRARSAAEVYASLTGAFGKSGAPSVPIETAATSERAYAMFRVKGEGKPLHALFRSNGEPVASAVADTWSRMSRRGADETPATRVAYFPSASASSAIASDAPPAIALPQPTRRAVDIPLPEARPAGLTGETQSPSRASRRQQPVGRPLDLLRFVKASATP